MQYIGLDLDGVIADTDALLRIYLHTIFGRKVTREDITSFYYEDCLSMSPEHSLQFWEFFRNDGGWEKINCIAAAKNALEKLSEKFRYIIITSRPEALHDVTEAWLHKHHIPFDELVVTSAMTKADVIRKNNWNITYFVEDRHDFAEDIASLGIKVFLLDYPWNRSFKETDTIHRVSHWDEIVERIRVGIHPQE